MTNSNKNNSGCAIAFIFGLLFLIICAGGSCSAGSSSHSYSTEESLEFADNISTPGTSEYNWYHDEYLPDNGYPDD